jgi:hypothetical protein
MKAGLEVQAFDKDCRYVNDPHWRMVNIDVPATGLAPLAVTGPGSVFCRCHLVEGGYVVSSLGDFEAVRDPESKCVDGTCRPMAA